MRTMISALACILAVAGGTALTTFELRWLLPPLLAVAATIALIARFQPHEPRWAKLAWPLGFLVCVGLLRGASVGAGLPEDAPRVGERGVSKAVLRTFVVTGASEPGPRCTFVVDAGGVPLRLSAPIETCPLSRGDEVAILAASLRPHWSASVGAGPGHVDLGRGPVVWRRSGPARAWIDLYWSWVAERRQRAWQRSRGDAASSLVFAAGLGLRAALEPARRDDLRAAGLGHLIAVSGLHVAVAALWLQLIARRLATLLGVASAWTCVLAWLPLWAYVALTGAAASAVRAAMMLTLIDLGTIVGRPVHPTTSLSVTAAAMLVWQPQWLSDPGFLLSLAAMAAIVTAPREQGVLATSWRITWATAPLSVWLFDAAPLHGVIGNAVALPLFGLMMPPALLASVGSGPIAALALMVARVFAAPILDLAAWLGTLPPLGPAALLSAACIALIASSSWARRHGSLHAWLPPRFASVLCIVICGALCLDAAASRRVPAVSRFDWIVVGSVYSRALLVADPASPGHACLYRPTGSARTWLWLLDSHDITHIDRLDAVLPDADADADAETWGDPPHDDPHTRALAESLVRGGIELGTTADRCRPPAPEQVRALLRSCRYSSGRTPVLARWWAGVGSCRIEDRWVIIDHADHGG